MRLVAFGDSFVEGLIKIPERNSTEERKKINFITQLFNISDRFTSYENCGVAGSSNKSIAYEVYKYLRQDIDFSEYFFLINWSGTVRGARYDEGDDMFWYAEGYLDDRQRIYESTMLILGIKQLLEERKIKYAFTNSFDNIFYSSNNDIINVESPAFINAKYPKHSLYDIIAERYKSLDTSECDFTQDDVSQFIAPCYHPTPKGHILIAEVLHGEIEKLLSTIYKE